MLKNFTMRLLFTLLTAPFSLLISCHESKTDVQAQNRYLLKLNPVLDSAYFYDMQTEVKTTMVINEKEIENLNIIEAGIEYIFNRDSLGNLIAKMRYDKFIIKQKDQNGEREINVAKILDAFRQATFTITLNESGEVLNLDGYTKLMELISKGENQQVQNRGQTPLNSATIEEFIRKNIEQNFRIFPGDSIKMGDNWQNVTKHHTDIKLDLKNTYRLQEMSNTTAVISLHAEVISDTGNNPIGGYSFKTALTGTQDGYIKVGKEDGMVISNRTRSSVKGMVQIMAKEVETEIYTNNKFVIRIKEL